MSTFLAMRSLPIEILWFPGASATYDLIRVLDLAPDAAYAAFAAEWIARETALIAEGAALPADAPPAEAARVQAALAANADAATLAVLGHIGCQPAGLHPAPVPGKPETWAHIHPALRQWLAQQGRRAAEAQLRSPLAELKRLRWPPA